MRPPDAERPATIVRFTGAQRLLHLVLAAATGVMLWTGLCLWSPALAETMSRPVAKQWHLGAAIALGAAFVLVVALRPREIGAFARAADRLDADDVAWLRGGPRRLVDHRDAPPQGWLNAGQKLNTAITAGLVAVLAGTGVLMLLGERSTAWRLGGSVPIHDVATALLVALLVGHLWLALVNPATRASLPGMTTGRVDRAWAREGHARWVDAEERRERPAPGRRGRYAAAAGAEEDR